MRVEMSQVLRMVGRIVAVAALIVWLGFFVEHVADWFRGPQMPPVPILFVPTITPALLFLAAWGQGRRANAQRLRA